MSWEKCDAFTNNINVFAKKLFAILRRTYKFERLVTAIEQYNARSKPFQNLCVQSTLQKD